MTLRDKGVHKEKAKSKEDEEIIIVKLETKN